MPAPSSTRHLARLRLVAQGIVGPRRGPPEATVRGLLGLQAQDYRSGVASLVVRGATGPAEVEAAFDAGTVVRAWPLRSTLHLVATDDLGWLRRLLAPRELAAAAGRERRLAITARVLGRAADIAVDVLSTEGPSTRTALTRAWLAGGIDTSGERSYHLVWHLAQTGVVCFGPVRGTQQLLVPADRWLPPPADLTRVEALAELGRRYFEGHGPATPSDLARWANLTVADTETAVAAARPHLATTTVDDREYLLGPTTEDELSGCRQEAADVVVLPGFDELIFGYRDRSPSLPDDRVGAVFPHANGSPTPTVLVDGRVVATWKRPPRGAHQPIVVTAVAPVSASARRTAQRRAAALG